MDVQTWIALSIVAGCAVFALWTLMPSALRRACAAAALHLPLPAALSASLRRTTQAPVSCSCDGCDKVKPSAPRAQAIRIHRRR